MRPLGTKLNAQFALYLDPLDQTELKMKFLSVRYFAYFSNTFNIRRGKRFINMLPFNWKRLKTIMLKISEYFIYKDQSSVRYKAQFTICYDLKRTWRLLVLSSRK